MANFVLNDAPYPAIDQTRSGLMDEHRQAMLQWKKSCLVEKSYSVASKVCCASVEGADNM